MSVIGSAATTIQRHVAGARQRADPLAEVVGVGEEERRVEAVEHESRDAAGVGIALGVVVALEVVDPAEHRVVRAPGPADEVQQRESDRDPDAPEHAEHGDAGERHHRQRELRASPVAQPPRGRRRRSGPRTATITIAASVDCGRSCTSPVPKIRSSARMPAPTSPATWLRAPTSSATAVRELLVEIGNPWKNPVAMFATPRTASSWFWSTSWRSRPA